MSQIVEIIYGDSLYATMKKSNLSNNTIIMFNTLFSVSNLSTASSYKLITKKELSYYYSLEYSFEDQMRELEKHIKSMDKIRIWSSHKSIESYLLLEFICYTYRNQNIDLYVTFSDNLKNVPSPACLKENELEELSKLETKLTKKEILEYSNHWLSLLEINSEMRVLENGEIKSVNFNYFDDKILSKLKELGTIKISRLVAKMMLEYDIRDTNFTYFIDELIKKNKIAIVEKSCERHFEDVIKIID